MGYISQEQAEDKQWSEAKSKKLFNEKLKNWECLYWASSKNR